MKCIKKASEVKRVEDDEAVMLLKSGWVYCPKSEWKAIRPTKSKKVDISEEAVELEVNENFKSSKKGMKVKKDRVPRNEASGGRGEKVSSGKSGKKGPRPNKPSKSASI